MNHRHRINSWKTSNAIARESWTTAKVARPSFHRSCVCLLVWAAAEDPAEVRPESFRVSGLAAVGDVAIWTDEVHTSGTRAEALMKSSVVFGMGFDVGVAAWLALGIGRSLGTPAVWWTLMISQATGFGVVFCALHRLGPMLIGMATSKRRRMQFSLRTVVLLVTVLCVALSRWVTTAERQRRAVAAIEALGGIVRYAQRHPAREALPVTLLRRRLPQDYLDGVKEVALYDTHVTDGGLACLQELTGLQELLLDRTHVTDAGLGQLQGMTGLRYLRLDMTEVTDVGMAHLQGLTRLRWLTLTGTRVTDTGLADLRGLTALEDLHLSGTQVTDAGLAHLQGLTGLKKLDLFATRITPGGIARLRRALPTCEVRGP